MSPFLFSPRERDLRLLPDLDLERFLSLSFFFCSGDRDLLPAAPFLASTFLSFGLDTDRSFRPCDPDRSFRPRDPERSFRPRDPDRFRDFFGLDEEPPFLLFDLDLVLDLFLRCLERDPDLLRRRDRDPDLFRRRERERDLVLFRRCLEPEPPRFLDRDLDDFLPFDLDPESSRRWRDRERDFFLFFDLDLEDAGFLMDGWSDLRFLSLEPDREAAFRTVLERSKLRERLREAARFPLTAAAAALGEDLR